jgi:hypothetical protein
MGVTFGQIYLTVPGPGGWGDGGGEGGGDDEDNSGPPWETVGPVELSLSLVIPAKEDEPGGGGVLPPPGLDGPSVAWRPIVTLDDADVSEIVIGEIEIRAQEGAARVARFALLFAPGTALSLSTWTGRTVTIDYAAFISGAIAEQRRLFTGIIDTPEFDAATGLIEVLATDDLQGELDAMTAAQIDALAEGRWSAVVFDAARSVGFQRAADRMSARAASLDLDVWRAPRVTPWFGTPQKTFTDDDIEDESLTVGYAARESLINRVTITFDYRAPLVKARSYGVSFDSVSHAAGKYGQGNGIQYATWASYIMSGHWVLTRQAVENAISSAGAEIAQMVWTPVPEPYNEPGTDWNWGYDPGTDQYLCRGFQAWVTFNSGGEMEETHVITVEAPNSIAQAGALTAALSGSLEGAYPEQTQVETQMAVHGALGIKCLPPKDYAPVTQGKLTMARGTLTPETDRGAANAAMMTLIDIARARIAEAHRQNEATATVILDPEVDTALLARIDTPRVKATGKVKSLTHRMDADSGRAVTTFTLAISSIGGVGMTHPETPTTAPAAASLGDKPLSGLPVVNFNSAETEDHVFSIEFPGMADADRNAMKRAIPTTIQAGLHEDEFTVTT